jgi:hypothetical protein
MKYGSYGVSDSATHTHLILTLQRPEGQRHCITGGPDSHSADADRGARIYIATKHPHRIIYHCFKPACGESHALISQELQLEGCSAQDQTFFRLDLTLNKNITPQNARDAIHTTRQRFLRPRVQKTWTRLMQELCSSQFTWPSKDDIFEYLSDTFKNPEHPVLSLVDSAGRGSAFLVYQAIGAEDTAAMDGHAVHQTSEITRTAKRAVFRFLDDQGTPDTVSLGDILEGKEGRTLYNCFSHISNEPFPAPDSNAYNTYKDIAHKPYTVDELCDEDMLASDDLRFIVEDYYRDVVSNKDVTKLNNVLQYLKVVCLFPQLITQKVLCLVSPEQGSGKNAFVDAITHILGLHKIEIYRDVSDLKHEFNASSLHKRVGLLDEITGDAAGKHSDWVYLRGLVTQKNVKINRKFKDIIVAFNMMNYIVTTNYAASIHVAAFDRRILMYTLSPARVGDKDFWNRYHSIIRTEHFARMFLAFLQRTNFGFGTSLEDVTTWCMQPALETEERKELRAEFGNDCDERFLSILHAYANARIERKENNERHPLSKGKDGMEFALDVNNINTPRFYFSGDVQRVCSLQLHSAFELFCKTYGSGRSTNFRAAIGYALRNTFHKSTGPNRTNNPYFDLTRAKKAIAKPDDLPYTITGRPTTPSSSSSSSSVDLDYPPSPRSGTESYLSHFSG